MITRPVTTWHQDIFGHRIETPKALTVGNGQGASLVCIAIVHFPLIVFPSAGKQPLSSSAVGVSQTVAGQGLRHI